MRDATILVDLYSNSKVNKIDGLDNYCGLTIHALPGLHCAVQGLLEGHGLVGTRSSVIDLGAGSGAMSLRYKDLGFTVTSSDYVVDNFSLDCAEYNFKKIDCNEEFSNSFNSEYNIVSAIELIEHLENPRCFLRQCRALLSVGGYVVLTTPNVDCSRSKADYVKSGTFDMFDDGSYTSSGHITPLTVWQLYKVVGECDFSIVEHVTFGPGSYKFTERPRMYILEKLIGLVSGGHAWGDGAIHLLLLKAR